MTSISQIPVQDLEQQHQQMMMKKLLFASCRHYWENDHAVLSSTKTADLITELLQAQPTLESLKTRLEQVVTHLNKPEKYYPIANQLIGKIGKLYGEAVDDLIEPVSAIKQRERPMNAPLTESSQLTQIVQEFEQDRNAQRIHKMLFALSKQRWENNPEILSSHPLQELTQDVHQKYSDLERLALSLLKILKGLNKQHTYSKVSRSIITQFAKLYQVEKVETGLLLSLVDLPTKQTLKQAKTTETYSSAENPKIESDIRRPYYPNYDSYQLRQRVMKYTNPLRVKMLLYYTLTPEAIKSQEAVDALLLKTYELDKMLEKLIYEYKTLQELQDNLETTALGISSIKNKMFSVDQNLQVAKAIVMSVKPLYAKN